MKNTYASFELWRQKARVTWNECAANESLFVVHPLNNKKIIKIAK